VDVTQWTLVRTPSMTDRLTALAEETRLKAIYRPVYNLDLQSPTRRKRQRAIQQNERRVARVLDDQREADKVAMMRVEYSHYNLGSYEECVGVQSDGIPIRVRRWWWRRDGAVGVGYRTRKEAEQARVVAA
jgi:hypothetical protein